MTAYLFTTTEGAKAFAKLPEGHPDFLIVRPEGKTALHSIESVREVIATSLLPPFEAPQRYILIEEADRLGVVCSNALLKTLEEPFAHTLFLLVSSHDLLPTLASRCRRMRLKQTPPEDKELEAQVARLLSVRGQFDQLVAEITHLEELIEKRKETHKLTASEKESYSLSQQEKLLKDSEGSNALAERRAREMVAYFILRDLRGSAISLELAEEKLKEMLVKTERFIPFSAALESFFLSIDLLRNPL